MTKLNQIIAVANGKKSRTEAEVTKILHQMSKPDTFNGLSKVYEPKDEDGEVYPPDSKHLQNRYQDLLEEAAKSWTDVMDVVATQEATNQIAAAHVMVDGRVILTEVPVTVLLFLERQLTHIRTLFTKIPLLDTAKEWEWSASNRCFITEPTKRTKIKKVTKFTVVVPPTPEHPAVVDKDYEDKVEGFWVQKEYSGAISEANKKELVARVDKLIEAVKKAREEANMEDVKDMQIGESIFNYLGVGQLP